MTNHDRPRRTRAALAGATVLSLALAACSGASSSPVPSAAATAPAASPPPGAPSPGGVDVNGVPAAVIDAAVADAAARAGVDPASVTLVSADALTFPDGGLGCPEEGMLYTQVLTPGYRVVVEAGGTEYDYRAGTRGGVRWCENPQPG